MKKTIYYTLSGLFMFIITLKAQAQALPTLAQQYVFLKWYIKHEKPTALSDTLIEIEGNILHISNFYHQNGADFKLTAQDKSYLKKQVKANASMRILNKAALSDKVWKEPGNHKMATWLSLPIFSVDGKVVFIRKKFYCGPLCGGEYLVAYLKIKAGWKTSKLDLPGIEY